MSNGGVLRRPVVPAPVRIRRDINNLAPNDPIIVFYRQAIGIMKGKPLRDPTSWRYQAAIHGYPLNLVSSAARRGAPGNNPGPDGPDPAAVDTDLPLPGDLNTFWRKCQHGSWFFLSWHRMYLHFFEQIIMNIVAGLPNGPSDWALPYWNYSISDAAALLPAPFRNPTLPDGTRNDLFVSQRTPRANQGLRFLDLDASGNPDPSKPDTNLNCLRQRPFTGNFGGPTGLRHDPGNSGALENTPHNAIHSGLGGSGGFMSLFSTAPLDPMFWLHHCNIDRLWEVWVQRQKQLGNLDRNPKNTGRANTGGWLDEPFDFHNATGTTVQMTSRQVLNTRVPPLSYEYEDISDPFNGVP
jgi:tyrosinase